MTNNPFAHLSAKGFFILEYGNESSILRNKRVIN
ncbi:hypothetical protein PAE9249_00821 [Paenibacillus sp. CECT 9249]|nr:hypothetical protein PAE9249_00821 [Paenibacillus sp. CECT 9249]